MLQFDRIAPNMPVRFERKKKNKYEAGEKRSADISERVSGAQIGNAMDADLKFKTHTHLWQAGQSHGRACAKTSSRVANSHATNSHATNSHATSSRVTSGHTTTPAAAVGVLCGRQTSRHGFYGLTRGFAHGFTLVELLVVISIISLLISILLPALKQSKEAARRIICASTLRQAGIGLMVYGSENNGALPTLINGDISGTSSPSWAETLSDILNGPGLFGWPVDVFGVEKDPMACPSWEPGSGIWVDYSYGANYPHGFGYDPGFPGWHEGVAKFEKIPLGMFLVADAGHYQVNNPRASPAAPVQGDMDTDWDNDGINDSSSWNFSSEGEYNGVRMRHNNAANFLIADGSVRNIKIEMWADNYNLENGALWGPWDPMDTR